MATMRFDKTVVRGEKIAGTLRLDYVCEYESSIMNSLGTMSTVFRISTWCYDDDDDLLVLE